MSNAAEFQLRHLLGPIWHWLDDNNTEEVAINKPFEAFVRQKGIFSKQEVQLSLEDLHDIAILAGALRRQDVGPRNPLCATEPGSAVGALASVNGRYQTGRWNRWTERNESQAERDAEILTYFDQGNIEQFLSACVKNRLTMLLCGATGSGKTTMGKTLIGAIPADERLITIEDTLELVIPHENHVRLLYTKAEAGTTKVTAESLLQASLRMRPDRILLGEMRDDAAWTYLNEVVSGHPGSISTIHGANPTQGFRKLFSLVKGSPQGAALEDRTLVQMLSAAIDVIVPFRTSGEIYEIGEVWFAADVRRRGETLAHLLSEA